LVGVLTPDRLAEPGVVEGPIGSTAGVGGPTPRPVRSCRGEDPAVSVAVAVHGSEATVLIDYQTVTAAELAAARRAGSPA
jgi:hypothetical protein